MYFWIGVPTIYEEDFVSGTPHRLGDPNRSISHIQIRAFYFVPQDRQNDLLIQWPAVLEEHLKELQEFHALQFQNKSALAYRIYPEAVIGDEPGLFYDTEVTQHGNPEALRRIVAELERRFPEIRQGEGTSVEKGVYDVIVILYEGVGASGGDNAALLSRTFFSDPQYKDVASTLLTHEFYHTLGIPDGYEPETAIPTTFDIMGLGRSRSLLRAYFDRKTLKEMGI